MSLVLTILFLDIFTTPVLSSLPATVTGAVEFEEDGILVFEEESDYEEKMLDESESEDNVLED